jgi:DNA-binding CsgD family transcriptional regulator
MLLLITPVERAALQLLAEGKNHVEIASRLETSTGELTATLSALFSRLGVRTPTDAITAGVKRGLVAATPPVSESELDRREVMSITAALSRGERIANTRRLTT